MFGRLVAGWAGRGQANGGAVRGRDGQSWPSNCPTATLSTGPDTLSTEGQVSPERVAVLVVWSTLALHPVTSWALDHPPGDTPASRGLRLPSIIWKSAPTPIHEFLQRGKIEN